MIYWLSWLYNKLAVQWYFKRVFVSRRKNVPAGKPVIIASNHPNAFMEPVVTAVTSNRPIHFLTRGDIFNKAWKRFLLGLFKMIPIYRRIDSENNFEQNKKTFDRSTKVLRKNGAILIFSEGICVMEKRLRPLMKGTAKLAFQAETDLDFNLDLSIVPMGVNYTYPDQFRSEMMIRYGEPIKILDFKEIYEENPARAINELNERIASELEKNIIIIDSKDDEALAETLLQIFRNDHSDTWKSRSRSEERLNIEKGVTDQINEWRKSNESKLNEITTKAKEYEQLRKKHGVSDEGLSRKKTGGLIRLMGLVLGFPFFIVGGLIHFWFFKLVGNFVKKKIRLKHFRSCIAMAMAQFIYLFLLTGMTITACLIFGWWGLLILLIVPWTGYIAIVYLDRLKLIGAKNKVRNLPTEARDNLEQLRNDLKEMINPSLS